MRNCRSRCCVIGFYFFHGKKKSHWRKREGLPWEWIGGGRVQSAIRGEGDSKKRNGHPVFLFLFEYHKCIAIPIFHA